MIAADGCWVICQVAPAGFVNRIAANLHKSRLQSFNLAMDAKIPSQLLKSRNHGGKAFQRYMTNIDYVQRPVKHSVTWVLVNPPGRGAGHGCVRSRSHTALLRKDQRVRETCPDRDKAHKPPVRPANT